MGASLFGTSTIFNISFCDSQERPSLVFFFFYYYPCNADPRNQLPPSQHNIIPRIPRGIPSEIKWTLQPKRRKRIFAIYSNIAEIRCPVGCAPRTCHRIGEHAQSSLATSSSLGCRYKIDRG